MNEQQQSIQRFWYTAPSRVHKDGSISHGGEKQRICAVTEGLNQDLYEGGAQERALKRYAHYTPPDGIGRDDISIFSTSPDFEQAHQSDAPICLSLIDIRNPEVMNDPELAAKLRGRVLVNKIYLGKIGDGREGNVFIDLLAKLPDGFSAREALALWRATDFWQQHYASMYAEARHILPPVELPSPLLHEIARRQPRITPRLGGLPSLPARIPQSGAQKETLRNPFTGITITKTTEKQLTALLTFLIHAYFLQQHEEWTITYSFQKKLSELASELQILKKTREQSGLLNSMGIPGKIKIKEQEYKQAQKQYEQRHLHFKRIYLAAEDDWIAYCLTLLASLFQDLPALLQPLTFSTYEYSVLKSECLIVGTSPSRAAEKEAKKVEALLPLECEKLGFVYNTYCTEKNTKLSDYLPLYDQQTHIESLRVKSVARDLARKLLKPNGRFEKQLDEVARQIQPYGPIGPVQQFVSLWQRKLAAADLLRKQYLSQAEVERLFQDAQWWEFLEEPEIARKVFQWVVADDKGFDLDQPLSGRTPPFLLNPGAEKQWLSRKLLPLIEQFARSSIREPAIGAIATSVAMNLCALLEEYADNLSQPDSDWPFEDDDHPTRSLGTSVQPHFDMLAFYKKQRDPQAFKVLLETLRHLESVTRNAPAWTRLFNYVFATRRTSDSHTFQHSEAISFVLRHLHDTALLETARAWHWDIHSLLLHTSAQVLPEEHVALARHLLYLPLERYWPLFGDDARRLTWHVSWRKEALLYQMNKFQAGGTLNVFVGHHWEPYRMTDQDIKNHRDFIGKSWQLHYLLVREALDCLGEWDDALPLVDDTLPQPFQAELIREFEKPELVNKIRQVILEQAATKRLENIRAVVYLYSRLLQGGCSEGNTLALLETWQKVWEQGQIAPETLHNIIHSATNVSQLFLQNFILSHKEAYKQQQAEGILIDCYQQTHEGQRQGVLFQLLDGFPVSQTTLDTLLSLSKLSFEEKIEFFARFAPTYLLEYFSRTPQERSKELWKLFTTLLDEEQESKNATLKPGSQPSHSWREAIVAILWLWLSAADSHEASFIDNMLKRIEPSLEEWLDIFTTFGGAYMTAGKADLIDLCLRYFTRICADSKLRSVEKLYLCLTLLPAESFPFTPKALSVQKTLEIFQTAALDLERLPSLVAELRTHVANQQVKVRTQAEQLVKFLEHRGRRVGKLLESLIAFWDNDIKRVAYLAKAVQGFLQEQVYREGYPASELELFLEFQEYQARDKRPGDLLPVAVYLRYLDVSDQEQIKLAEPFKDAYSQYLQHFSPRRLEPPVGTIELLKILSGTGALDKTIDALSNGLLRVQEFLQARQQDRAKREDEVELAREELQEVASALRELQQAQLTNDSYKYLTHSLIVSLVPCVSDKLVVSRILELGPALFGAREKNPGFALLLAMSKEASIYYRIPQRREQQKEWFAPYLEILPSLGEELNIKRDVGIHRNKIMEALLFVHCEPDEATVLAFEAYLQRATAAKLLTKVVKLWEDYKIDPRIDVLLKATQSISSPESVPIPQESGGAETSQPTPQEPEILVTDQNEDQDLADRRLSWIESFWAVWQLRQAIRRADRGKIQTFWGNTRIYYMLRLHQEQIGRTYWEYFQSLRQLDDTYQALKRADTQPTQNVQQLQEDFVKCVECCDNFIKGIWLKWMWKNPVSPEQRNRYNWLKKSDISPR